MNRNFFEPFIKIPVNNPKELLLYMDKIKYGWMDIKNKKYFNFDEWFNNCVIISPYKVNKYKIGTCYEQALFEYFIFKNQFYDYTELKLIHIHQNYISNHLFLAYKYKNKWYYFEHSFDRFKGIYGPYNSLIECIRINKKHMLIQSKSDGYIHNMGFKIIYLDINKLYKNIKASDFYKLIDYNYIASQVFYHGSSIQNLKYIESEYNLTNNKKYIDSKYNNVKNIYAGSTKSLSAGFTFQWNDDMGIKYIEHTLNKKDYNYVIMIPYKYKYFLKNKCSIYIIPANGFRHYGLDNEYVTEKKKIIVLKEIKYSSVRECLTKNFVKIVIV